MNSYICNLYYIINCQFSDEKLIRLKYRKELTDNLEDTFQGCQGEQLSSTFVLRLFVEHWALY